jgi:ABC-type transport system substrate-binding protein
VIGTKLSGRYEIVAELGRGGMGVVYRARDPLLNREVAVKQIPRTSLTPEAELRFQREAQIVAQMDHPAIVPIHDFGRHEDSLFFVMPVVQGTSLRAFLRQGPQMGEVLDVGIQVAEALEYSHARGVVHRDIKPDNIMVSRGDGGEVRVRVMDFGLARADRESHLTKTGTFLGTLAYVSPEQVLAKALDGRSDVYSLGVVLYECFVGSPPFSGEVQSLLYRIVHEQPQPPRARGAAIGEELERTVLACLAKEPAQRPQRAGELKEALRRYRARLRDTDRTATIGPTLIEVQPPAAASFMGRAKELGELQQRLNAAIAGECQFVILGGEPGIGKTRLLEELATLARARQVRVLQGRCLEQDRSFPFQGFCDLIQEYFRLKDTGSAPAPDFSDLAPDLVALFPILNEVSGIRHAAAGEPSAAPPAATAGPESRTQVFELLARTLTRMSGGRPLLLILEDLHAAEVSLEALQYVVRRLGPTPTLIAGSYRTSEVDSRHPLHRMLESFRGDRRFAALTLGPLSPSEHRHLLETLVGAPAVKDSLATRLYEGTEGNPFFVTELVRSLLDSGGIRRDESGAFSLSLEVGISADALPATIQQAVGKRIERLPEDLREVLSVASVIGRRFDARDLEKLAEGRGDLDELLDRLLRGGYLQEERESRGDVLSFSSGVVRDVLYAALSRRRRRSLHRRYAELVEARHAGRQERALPELVHHFSQGDVPEKSVAYGLRLAQASLDAWSAEEAARAARTALEFLDEEWQGERSLEGDARMLLARAYRMGGDLDGALREAAAAIRAFESQGLAARVLSGLVLAAETAWQARRSEEAGRWAEKGLAAARAAAEPESLRQLLSLAATLANLRGEHDKGNAYLEEAARLGPGPRDAAAEEPVARGGRLVVGLANAVRSVEPQAAVTTEEAEVAANVFETLLAMDAEGNLAPSLCERWEPAEEGRSFVLTLRPGVRFQGGRALKAADVKDSFERSMRRLTHETPPAFSAILGVREALAGEADEIAGIKVLADLKLEIRLREPLPIYPALLTDVRTGLWREERGGGPLGTGPFRIASVGPDRVVLERHEGYWRGAPALLDAIEFRPGLRASAIAAAFRAGELDVARDLLPQDLEEILQDPAYRAGLVERPVKSVYFALFNTRTGPSARRLWLRCALAGTVRTRDLVWRALGRFAEPATGLIPPGMLGHDPGRRRAHLDRDQARDLLRSAGLDPPIRLTAAVHPLLQDRYGSLTRALFEAWADLGVEVQVATSTMESFLEADADPEAFDVRIGRRVPDYDDPDDLTHTLFHSETGRWRNWFCSAEADEVLQEARAEKRPAAREVLYRKFESLLQESAALIPLFHEVDYRLAGPRVSGLRLTGRPPFVNYGALGKRAAPAPGPKAGRAGGGTLHVPIAGVVANLDPALTATFEQSEVLPSVFESLTRIDPGAARIAPALAAEFRAEEGGRRYRFRLWDDVRFHDGRRLSTRDVRYSLERLLCCGDSSYRWMLAPIKGARPLLEGQAAELSGLRIHSPNEFSIELTEPVAFFPALVAYPATAIIPEGSDPSGGGGPSGWVGTGPFRVVLFEPGRRLELERNRSYRRPGYPRSDGLVYTFGVAPEEMLAGLRAGRFSLASDLFPADAEALRREPEFASGYRETPRLVTYYAAFNTRRGPLADRARRRRLSQAVDVARIVRQTLGRLAIPAHSLIPPGLLGHDPAPAARPGPPQSVEEPEGPATIELSAAVHPQYFDRHAALARELAGAFAHHGVKIRPVNKTMAEWLEATTRGAVDLVVGRWGADYPDPDTFAYLLHSQGGYLGRVCGSAELDRLIEKGRAESAPSARHAVYREVEAFIAREALLLPLFHEQAYRFARPEVDGLSVSFGHQAVAYEELRRRG